MKFTSLDFETANDSEASICAAGIAVFEDGKLLDTRHWLIHPPAGHDYFRDDFIEIHGITPEDVKSAPEFPAVAEELLPYLTGTDFVIAHNARFDIGILFRTLIHFGMKCPTLSILCTYQTASLAWPGLPNHALPTVASYIGHTFRHHNALEDAEAAGRVLLAIIKKKGEKWTRRHIIMRGVCVISDGPLPVPLFRIRS